MVGRLSRPARLSTDSRLTFPGSGAGRSGLMMAGGAREEDAGWGLGGCLKPAASGFRQDSITSLVTGGVTTGATLSGFPGSGAGGSTLMAAGGAGEEDVDGGLHTRY